MFEIMNLPDWNMNLFQKVFLFFGQIQPWTAPSVSSLSSLLVIGAFVLHSVPLLSSLECLLVIGEKNLPGVHSVCPWQHPQL